MRVNFSREHLGPHGIDFNKIGVFCGKYCIHINKYVFIVIKIKCVNSDRINDICDKVNFTTNYTLYNIWMYFDKILYVF